MKDEKELAIKHLNLNGPEVPKRRDLWNKIIEQSQKIKELEEERKQLKLELKMFKSVNEFINGYSIEKAREVFWCYVEAEDD